MKLVWVHATPCRKPLLEAACALIPALEIELDPRMRELKWVESFLIKCSNLKQLCVRFATCGGYIPGLHHRFFNDIAATPRVVPPVETLMLVTNGFTQAQLTKFVGRFKDTIRSIELCDIHIDEDGSWASFLGWLQENIPNLERFEFQALQHGRWPNPKTVCFESIFKDPELVFKDNPRTQNPYVELAGGRLELDTYRATRGNGPVCNVAFKGSNAGAREALRLLALAAVPRALREGLTRCMPRIRVW
ncbi:hypothetical protein VTN96DRAFT_332 [Rasamsonia emersonii]